MRAVENKRFMILSVLKGFILITCDCEVFWQFQQIIEEELVRCNKSVTMSFIQGYPDF